jgi:antitoxin component YwqK of YwqJK toxin-antitoxin module
MKLLNATTLLLTLFLFSCGQNGETPNNSSDSNETNELNWDDPKVREEIFSKAIEQGLIQWKDELGYAPEQQTPYTGWVGSRHANGEIAALWYSKEGVKDGSYITWHDNGQKSHMLSYKNNKAVGLVVKWDRDGKEVERYSNSDGNKSAD